ncbi:MAG: sulfite exporter TauE/SafE family protein [Gammaproteobacteria bacterium]|nr:sulfite exporter TauE/SafE family protein [Gammaproteobacteria bacterium]
MIDPVTFLIVPLSFVGFVLKGIATFGPGIIMVPVGALIFGVREMIMLSACLDLISNVCLFRPSKNLLHNTFWLGMVLAMIAGAATGAILLSYLPVAYFDIVFGLLLLPLGLWIMLTGRQSATSSNQGLPTQLKSKEILLSFLAGCMSGLSGITAPILAWHFNRHYNKHAFRSIMLPLLLASAITRIISYTLSGTLTLGTLPLVWLSMPGLILGLWYGNRLFLKISQRWFGLVIGSLISLSGVKLLFR